MLGTVSKLIMAGFTFQNHETRLFNLVNKNAMKSVVFKESSYLD